jgi:hypothetical protein
MTFITLSATKLGVTLGAKARHWFRRFCEIYAQAQMRQAEREIRRLRRLHAIPPIDAKDRPAS